MNTVPKFIEGSKTLLNPFEKDGSPSLVTSILATLLPNIPLKKETLLGKISEHHAGRTRGYLSNHFSELSKLGILKFTKRDKTWRQGINYQEYMGFVFMRLVNNDEHAVASLKYRLMPKKSEQSMDFISSPTDDVFDQPNQYLDD